VGSLPSVAIAGAGIGGLTAALALARRGFPVIVLEQAERLEPIGAGIQLSPNASRVLIDLGLRQRLDALVVEPQRLNVMAARSGRTLASAPLGADAEHRYGAPFWVIHRGDLHAVLCEAVDTDPLVALRLGARVDDFAARGNGVTVHAGNGGAEEIAGVLIGADGLWSAVRGRFGRDARPRFAGHTAWRALIPADDVPREMGKPAVNLWLGRDGHLVHYPVQGGKLINVVVIMRDDWREPGWSAPGDPTDLLRRIPAADWHGPARDLIGAASQWQKWALYDAAPLARWGSGPVTLLGDAAHPMLPFLAQGGAMAIEDAAVLAQRLAEQSGDVPAALRRYEDRRQERTARTQRAARRNGIVYHLRGAGAVLRSLALMGMGGNGLLRQYDWLYRWQPD